MMAIYLFGSEEQKKRWLPAMAKGEKLRQLASPNPISDPILAACIAAPSKPPKLSTQRREKMRSGNGHYRRCRDRLGESGRRRRHRSCGREAVRGFLVERGTPGFRASLIEGKLSLRAAYRRTRIQQFDLPASALLPESTGLPRRSNAQSCRYGIAWGAIGAGHGVLRRSAAVTRKAACQFDRPIGGFQLVQAKLARMLTEITKAQLLALRLAQLKRRRRIAALPHLDGEK